jgi:hypothetical protein
MENVGLENSSRKNLSQPGLRYLRRVVFPHCRLSWGKASNGPSLIRLPYEILFPRERISCPPTLALPPAE